MTAAGTSSESASVSGAGAQRAPARRPARRARLRPEHREPQRGGHHQPHADDEQQRPGGQRGRGGTPVRAAAATRRRPEQQAEHRPRRPRRPDPSARSRAARRAASGAPSARASRSPWRADAAEPALLLAQALRAPAHREQVERAVQQHRVVGEDLVERAAGRRAGPGSRNARSSTRIASKRLMIGPPARASCARSPPSRIGSAGPRPRPASRALLGEAQHPAELVLVGRRRRNDRRAVQPHAAHSRACACRGEVSRARRCRVPDARRSGGRRRPAVPRAAAALGRTSAGSTSGRG